MVSRYRNISMSYKFSKKELWGFDELSVEKSLKDNLGREIALFLIRLKFILKLFFIPFGCILLCHTYEVFPLIIYFAGAFTLGYCFLSLKSNRSKVKIDRNFKVTFNNKVSVDNSLLKAHGRTLVSFLITCIFLGIILSK